MSTASSKSIDSIASHRKSIHSTASHRKSTLFTHHSKQCLICKRPIHAIDQTITLAQPGHSCNNRIFEVHRDCLQTCNCPKFEINHDTDPHNPPYFQLAT